MASKIGGVTVAKNGKILWGTLASVVLGVPLYAFSREVVEFIQLYGGAVSTLWTGISSWLSRFVAVGLSSPATGFGFAYQTFAHSITEFGVFAFIVSIVVSAVTVGILLMGVTRFA